MKVALVGVLVVLTDIVLYQVLIKFMNGDSDENSHSKFQFLHQNH